MDYKERDMLLGNLTRKERERDAIETKIDRCIKDLNYYSYPSDGIKSIECDAVLQAANELKQLCDRWAALNREIEDLEARVL